MTLFLILTLSLLVLWWIAWSIDERNVWSVGVYWSEQGDPERLEPHPRARQPVLSAADVTDVDAAAVADPFVARDGERWYLFVEVVERARRRGAIGLATSADGITWRYERIVLREPFHLSYPYVFFDRGVHYMIPETRRANAVRLYRAEAFPYGWRFERELMRGDYHDPSIVRRDDRWWLFALRGRRELTLHGAERLEGTWTEHPASPLAVDDPSLVRPGGRITVVGDRLLRFAQDDAVDYGRAVRAFEIVALDTSRYEERELPGSPILVASGRGWNADGMHHVDLVDAGDGTLLAYVDGKCIVRCFRPRKGARRVGAVLTTPIRHASRKGTLRASR